MGESQVARYASATPKGQGADLPNRRRISQANRTTMRPISGLQREMAVAIVDCVVVSLFCFDNEPSAYIYVRIWRMSINVAARRPPPARAHLRSKCTEVGQLVCTTNDKDG